MLQVSHRIGAGGSLICLSVLDEFHRNPWLNTNGLYVNKLTVEQNALTAYACVLQVSENCQRNEKRGQSVKNEL